MSDWDGFFNNYFLYHDLRGTGKWTFYPWDEDKTWGDYDGASSSYEWYTMPLNYGSAGSTSSMADMARFGGGPFGGSSWWRPPGYFSGPLLSNPEFRKRFLIRLKQICETVFTEERFMPIINSMEARLAGEGESGSFRSDMKSFKNQLINRRKFLLSEIAKELEK